jgi:hypothetical protein
VAGAFIGTQRQDVLRAVTGFSGPSLKDFWGREMGFFARYLKPGR